MHMATWAEGPMAEHLTQTPRPAQPLRPDTSHTDLQRAIQVLPTSPSWEAGAVGSHVDNEEKSKAVFIKSIQTVNFNYSYELDLRY